MKIAAYTSYAVAAIVAIVGIYSVFILRTDFDGAVGTFVLVLFVIGTLVPLFAGIGLMGMARDREEDER
jgi:hypothetical protein